MLVNDTFANFCSERPGDAGLSLDRLHIPLWHAGRGQHTGIPTYSTRPLHFAFLCMHAGPDKYYFRISPLSTLVFPTPRRVEGAPALRVQELSGHL